MILGVKSVLTCKRLSKHTTALKCAGAAKLKIEKEIKIPRVKRFPFDKMEIGDSLFFEELTQVESAQNAGHQYGKTHKNGFKMTRRKVDNGYRLWRIA